MAFLQQSIELDMRTSGILLHPTSLPGRRGSGDLGSEARRFVRFLERAGQTWWQMLPIHPPGPGNSPYQALSTFAGSPLLIDLEELVALGLIPASELDAFSLSSRRRADFIGSAEGRLRLLRRAFDTFDEGQTDEIKGLAAELEAFREQQSHWLEEWVLYATLRDEHDLASWVSWSAEFANRDPDALKRMRCERERECRRHAFYQWLFERQWSALRSFASDRGVRILGDLPMFVAHDSADVWSRRELFRLDEGGHPLFLSGAPPDDFNPHGQTWGHPLFDWGAVAEADWDWWRDRARRAMALSDLVRLDHFVGYEAAWEIPAASRRKRGRKADRAPSAGGSYGKGPGADLFEALRTELGELPFVAEDLGDVSEAVEALRKQLGFPGMRVLQFAFTGESEDNIHLPVNHIRDSIAYTGTHDNDTLAGWLAALERDGDERERVLAYAGVEPDSDSVDRAVHRELLRLTLGSIADCAILPAQDLFGMGTSSRMNRPGTTHGNWRFRLRPNEINDDRADELADLTREANRFPDRP